MAGLVVLVASLGGEHPGLSLAEVPGGMGPMVLALVDSSVLTLGITLIPVTMIFRTEFWIYQEPNFPDN